MASAETVCRRQYPKAFIERHKLPAGEAYYTIKEHSKAETHLVEGRTAQEAWEKLRALKGGNHGQV